MTQYEVQAPSGGFTGESCGAVFRDGAAVVSDADAPGRAALAYFRRRGYRVTEVEPPSAVEPIAPEPADDVPGDPAPVEPPPSEVFDPADYTVADVVAYLADADEDERARVLAAEAAGEARATILKKGTGQ